MRIAVLGAGNGGHAMAAELTLKGHDVVLHTGNEAKLHDLQKNGGITISGVLGDRHVPLTAVTNDIKKAVTNAQLIAMPVPGMVQEQYLRSFIAHVRPGQAIWLCPGTGGTLIADRMLREAGKRGVLLIETLTLPYGARRTGPASVAIIAVIKAHAAAFPANRNAEALALLRECFDFPEAKNVLETALMNVNCMIHPLPSLMNWGSIEQSDRYYSIYAQGMTPGVLKSIHALDRERVAVCAAAGVRTTALDDIYTAIGIPPVYRMQLGVGKADKYEDRFITEDVPVGLVTISSVGAQLGVPTPGIDAVIRLSGVLYGLDFWSTGRTAEKLGLTGMTAAQLERYLDDGGRDAR